MSARRLLGIGAGVLLAVALLLWRTWTPTGADLPAPADLHVVTAGPTTAQVAWFAPGDAGFFRVVWSPTEGTGADRSAWTSRSTVVLTGLEPSTSYDVRVRAVDGDQPLSPLSGPLVVTTTGPPADPGTSAPSSPSPADTLFGANYTTDPLVHEGVYGGRAEVARVFFQLLDDTSFTSHAAVREALDDGVRTFVISWKETDRGAIRRFLAAIPDRLTVYTAYHHEPEDDHGPPGTASYDTWAADYRAEWVRQSRVMRAAGCIPTSILQAHTLDDSSGRDVADWTPPPGTVDVFAFDAYYGSGKDPETLAARMSAAASTAGVAVTGLAETGASFSDPTRLENTAAMRAAVLAAGSFAWAIYWNSAEGGFDSRMDRALANAWFDG